MSLLVFETTPLSRLGGEGTLGRLYADETLYLEAERALKKVGKAAEDIEEQTPISALGVVLGFIF